MGLSFLISFKSETNKQGMTKLLLQFICSLSVMSLTQTEQMRDSDQKNGMLGYTSQSLGLLGTEQTPRVTHFIPQYFHNQPTPTAITDQYG